MLLKRLFCWLILGLCSSCTYTYLPPIPRGRTEPAPRLDLHASAGISSTIMAGNERLVLQLSARDVPAADWLAVQWFAPDNQQVASASQWLEPSPNVQDLRFVLSADVPLRPGDWRAVVSYRNQVARQFSVVLEADDPAPANSNEQATPTDTPTPQTDPDTNTDAPDTRTD